MSNNPKGFLEHAVLALPAALSGAVGFLAGGPITAGVTAAAGTILNNVIADVAERRLSESEKFRAATVALDCITQIQLRIADGYTPREDGFFRMPMGKELAANQLFEGALLKARSEYDERKLIYISSLFANLCFDESLSADEANWYLGLLETLTLPHIEVLYAFSELRGRWKDNNLGKALLEHSYLSGIIQQLRSLELLTPPGSFERPVEISKLGEKFLLLISYSVSVNISWPTSIVAPLYLPERLS